MAFLLVSSLASASSAEEASLEAGKAEPEDPSGIESEGRDEDQDAERFVDGVTWLPRQLLFAMVRAQAIVARFAHDQQLVPRYEQLLSGHPDARVFVFPTLFAETRSTFSVGVRALAEYGPWATQARVGFGGVDDWAVQGSAQYAVGFGRVPVAITVEALADNASDLEYHGVGQSPEDDPRNEFIGAQEIGRHREERRRIIGSIGLRPAEDLQLLYSMSVLHRRVEDARDVEGEALSQVFGSVPSWGPSSWLAYYELALRHDSRPVLGPEMPGVVSESYGGYAHRVRGERIAFARVGGRLAAFLPIHRPTNILSPRIVVDQVVAVGDDPVPFTELARQPTYRGDDNRRDDASLVMSVDYAWRLAVFMNARLFVDGASVGPTVGEAFTVVPRFAGGFGFDFFTNTIKLARVQIAGSADGFHARMSIGEQDAWGDRQRRD
jgi:hypothetical protein